MDVVDTVPPAIMLLTLLAKILTMLETEHRNSREGLNCLFAGRKCCPARERMGFASELGGAHEADLTSCLPGSALHYRSSRE